MTGKYALIIGNTEYTDPGLAELTAPGKDTEDFAHVLRDKNICAFDDVTVILNQPEYVIREAVDDFFNQRKPEDLLVLYFSGHGVRDELGTLYLAVKNTMRTKLRATGIRSDYISEAMDQSRSRRQVLILDCCNSGAFARGTKAATGVSMGTATAFEAGYGRVILTASDSTQFAWEGDTVIGETNNSLFTHFLVKGLAGEADLDGDGCITVDELYDYTFERVRVATPRQTPSKFSSKQQGEIILRKITSLHDVKPVTLSEQLLSEMENPYPEVRLRAVGQLAKILNGKNLGLARSAREALEKLEREDDSRRVSLAARQSLEAELQKESQRVEEVTEPIADSPLRRERAPVVRKVDFQQPAFDIPRATSGSKFQKEAIENNLGSLLSSWKGRVLAGAGLGLFLGLLNLMFFSIYYEHYADYMAAILLDGLVFAIACGLAGLLMYPHKLSLITIAGGFFVVGLLGYGIAGIANIVPSYLAFNFLAFGALLGVPAGAALSQILHKRGVID